MVKAFRLLNRRAWGFDTSVYANIESCIPMFMTKTLPEYTDWVIAKDVFEHLTKDDLNETLGQLRCQNIFIVVPLAVRDKYVNPDDEKDVTHIIREGLGWWNNVILGHFKAVEARFRFGRLKDDKPPNSYGFITGRIKR